MVDLRENELRTLSTLSRLKGKASVEQLVAESGLSDAAVMRAALTMKEKKLVNIIMERQTTLELNDEGRLHAKKGLPERRLINALDTLGGRATCEKAFEKACLEKRFMKIALGWTQRKKWTTFDGNTDKLQSMKQSDFGDDEKLLEILAKREALTIRELSPELQETAQILKGRKLLDIQDRASHLIELTESGREVLRKTAKTVPELTQLTQELIISGKWRKVNLQKYNIEAPVAKTWPGKKHPYMEFLEQVKSKLVLLGFKEMVGTAVETSLFNFDALYTPQDHPAREASDIYFIKSPKEGSIDAYRKIVANIKKTHENGWKTGSTGWRYKYSLKEARRLILRGHGTCLSARTLISRHLEIPGRYFSIVRCYRPEVVDRTHLSEFNQVEGIVIEENLNLRDLLGVLGTFATEIAGADKVRFRPDYFPFTEPSVELAAYKEGYGWLEFGGSGIFRPEVTRPLGIKHPVIAWGLGIDRLFMMKAKIEEIRYMFSQDLNWLRKTAVI
jgi:phenylalanyl-tRNA synthetase alpha chain